MCNLDIVPKSKEVFEPRTSSCFPVLNKVQIRNLSLYQKNNNQEPKCFELSSTMR